MLNARVRWGETDAGGIVFYPNYFHWFDWGTHELFHSMGLPIQSLLEQGILTPILGAACDFSAPLYYDDDITITSSFAELKTKTFRIEHVVRRGDVVTGRGHEWRGWVVRENGNLRAVTIPEEVRRLMQADG